MSEVEMAFWERAATAALTGLCVRDEVEAGRVVRLAAELADALVEAWKERLG